MKAIILAGGSGTRLQPFTHTTQKQLLPVANRPVLEYVVENLQSAGVEKIAFVIGGDHPQKIQDHFGSGDKFNIEITYINQGEPHGLADAVRCAQDFVGTDPFLVYFGDTLIAPDIIQTVVNEFDPSGFSGYLPLQNVSEPSRFGIVEFEDERLVQVHEKPADPPSTLAYMGMVAFTPSVFEHINKISESDRGELELTDAIDSLVQNESVQWKSFQGMWVDVGTPPDLIKANKIMLEKMKTSIDGEVNLKEKNKQGIRVGKNSIVNDNVDIIAPVSIGRNVSISGNATIGPYVAVGDGCRINNANIKQSVLLNDADIDYSGTIKESIIGSEVVIEESDNQRRLIVGSDSTLTI